MRALFRVTTSLMVVLLLGSPALADYSLARSVFGNGAGDVWGGGYLHQATVGQAAIGLVSGVVYEHGAGFWYGPTGGGSDVAGPVEELPRDFAFSIESGNPVPGTATIRFALPAASRVRIGVFDVTGRQVRTLADGERQPGHHTALLSGDGLAAGVYFCRMVAGDWNEVRRLVLVR